MYRASACTVVNTKYNVKNKFQPMNFSETAHICNTCACISKVDSYGIQILSADIMYFAQYLNQA